MDSLKVGRNDPCPCGSGKKFKHCCLKYFPKIKDPSTKAELGLLKTELRKYNQEEIISILAGLQLIPKNHTHLVRLEIASRIACSIKKGKNEKFEAKEFELALNKYLAPFSNIGILEDPPEQLFTENIEFFGGNYIIYPGLFDCEPFVLRNLFRSIFFSDDEYPKEFGNLIVGTSLCILGLSNDLAKKMNHTRYMVSPNTWHEQIEIPDEKDLKKLLEAVRYTEQELIQLFEPTGVDFRYISPFLNSAGDNVYDEKNLRLNPLFIKPLVMCGDLKIIVAHPNALGAALRHYILVTAEEHHCKNILMKNYQKNIFESVMKSSRLMGFVPINIPLPLRSESLPIDETLYIIDKDKIAYSIVITDNAEAYDRNNICGEWDSSEIEKKVNARIDQMVAYFGEKSIVPENILILKIYGKIGRRIISILDNNNPLKIINLSADELELISQLLTCEPLTFWKFNEAFKKFDVENYVEFCSFLDLFYWYTQHNYSFNFGDRDKVKCLNIIAGSGRDLRIESAKKFDFHSGEKEVSGRFTTVCKLHLTDNVPIYTPFDIIDRPVTQLVEGYQQPIWIDTDTSRITSENLSFFTNMSDFFSYWIWQMTPGLSPFLLEIGPEPIEIRYEFDNLEQWIDPNLNDFKKAVLSCNFHVDKRIITINLPSDLIPYFMKPDNFGERIICSSILSAFDCMIFDQSQTHPLNDAQIRKILDDFVPIGPKKKISILGSGTRGLLIPYFTPPARMIQTHDFQEQSENVIRELDQDLLSRDYSIKSEQTALCRGIFDVYLKRIRESIKDYSCDSLFFMLIGNYEGLLHHQEKIQFMTPFIVSCYTDVNELNKQMSKDIPDIFSTSISVRILLEFISAEPPNGEKEIGICEMDRLLAMAKHLIHWAMIGDRIYFDLVKIENISFKTGDITLIPFTRENVDGSFFEAKTLETIELALIKYEDQFEMPERKTLSEIDTSNYDRAYFAEFGISFKDLYLFFACLIHSMTLFICPEQKSPVLCLPLSEFKTRLILKLNWTEKKIDHAIEQFSLKPRERWDISPPGFVIEDIEPWRNNRRLSYMRKPLIISPQIGHEPVIYWGPLHVEASFNYLRELVRSGRYKNPISQEMQDLLNKTIEENSDAFVNAVKEWFLRNSSIFVDSNVLIGPREILCSDKDLGDVDILLIDDESKKIISIECKNINFGRNAREIDNEISRFLGDRTQEDSWVGKHLRRDEWLKNNVPLILSKYNKKMDVYRTISIIFLSTEIFSTFYRDFPLLTFSFSRLEREGISMIKNL